MGGPASAAWPWLLQTQSGAVGLVPSHPLISSLCLTSLCLPASPPHPHQVVGGIDPFQSYRLAIGCALNLFIILTLPIPDSDSVFMLGRLVLAHLTQIIVFFSPLSSSLPAFQEGKIKRCPDWGAYHHPMCAPAAALRWEGVMPPPRRTRRRSPGLAAFFSACCCPLLFSVPRHLVLVVWRPRLKSREKAGKETLSMALHFCPYSITLVALYAVPCLAIRAHI